MNNTGCGLCKHAQAADINAAILADTESLNQVADRFGVPRSSLKRHAPHARRSSPAPPSPAPVEVIAPAPKPTPAPPPPSEPLNPRPGHPCETCRSPYRAAIEAALFELAPVKQIEARFPDGPSDNSIRRHVDRCIRTRLEDALVDRFKSAREEADGLLQKARRLLDEAESAGDFSERAKTLVAAKGIVELLARITGEIAPAVNIQMVLALPDWQRMEAQLVAALLPHPEALRAVKVVLVSLRTPALSPGSP